MKSYKYYPGDNQLFWLFNIFTNIWNQRCEREFWKWRWFGYLVWGTIICRLAYGHRIMWVCQRWKLTNIGSPKRKFILITFLSDPQGAIIIFFLASRPIFEQFWNEVHFSQIFPLEKTKSQKNINSIRLYLRKEMWTELNDSES